MDDQEIFEALRSLGCQVEPTLEWIGDSNQRPFSSIREFQVRVQGGTKRFLLKECRGEGSSTIRLNRLAQAGVRGEHYYFPLIAELRDVPGHRQHLVMEFFDGTQLSRLLNRTRFFQGVSSRARFFEIGRWIGDWLAGFHSSDRQDKNPEDEVRYYLQRRREIVDCLSDSAQSDLEEACTRLGQLTISPSHGDYTPHNLLLSDEALCVIDIGIREWEYASPAWDIACFQIGVQRAIRYKPQRPIWWMPFLVRDLMKGFRASYDVSNLTEFEWHFYFALRHLIYCEVSDFEGDASFESDVLTKWHLREFERHLDLSRKA